jgi:hypothetical protein
MRELDRALGRRTLLLAVLAVLVSAGCGGGTPRNGRTVTFSGGGAFPPSTIVGNYSVHGCTSDARTLVRDARSYYVHSTSGPGPADLYYDDMRLSYAHFEADACTNEQLGQAMKRGLTPRQQRFLLANLASDLRRAFRAAMDAMR